MLSVKTLQGGKVGVQDVDEAAFGDRGHPVLLRDAVIMYQANQRVGTVKVKTRAEVSGSTKKMNRQKHTGRARHGDKKAPQFRGGGIAHGPVPRDHSYTLPRKALRKALGIALARKLTDGEVLRWQGASFPEASTKAAREALKSLEAASGALLVAPGPVDKNLLLSVRNLPRVKALPASEVTAFEVVAHRRLVLLDGALEALQERITQIGKGGHSHEPRNADEPRSAKSEGRAS